MPDTTIFAWTEPTPPEGYPAYVNFKQAEDDKCYITVRSRGNGGRDQACIEVSPQVLESLQCDLCEWLYREDTDSLMSASEAEVDAELRRLGIDPAEAERQGKAAVECALETVRAHKAAELANEADAALSRLRDTQRELVEAASAGLEALQQSIKDVGGCDHSAGICMCSDIRAATLLRAALASVEEQPFYQTPAGDEEVTAREAGSVLASQQRKAQREFAELSEPTRRALAGASTAIMNGVHARAYIEHNPEQWLCFRFNTWDEVDAALRAVKAWDSAGYRAKDDAAMQEPKP